MYCEGNPGHGPITVAQARYDDDLMIYKHDDGVNESYHETNRRGAVVQGRRS